MNKIFRKKIREITILFIGVIVLFYNCFKKPTEVSNDKIDENLYNLRITEIHYDPDSFGIYSGDSLEFIELKNIGSSVINLGDLQITEGVNYIFTNENKIQPQGFFVLASNSKAFQERYGFAPDGVYSGQLKNSGEKITIVDVKHNRVIISQEYADSGAWENKGKKGYSLVPIDINPEKHPLPPEKWRRSVRIGGSPGKDDIKKEVDPLLYNLRITEINYHPLSIKGIPSDSLEFIEIKNIGSEPVNIGNLEFTAGIKYVFPSDAKIEAGGFIVLVSNINAFKKVYPNVNPYGVYRGQLSDKGEKIAIADGASGEELIVIDYKDSLPWPELADGKGGSLVPIKSNPDRDQNNPSQWRRSLKVNGSPGADDPGIVLINEILTHTDPPLKDAIELYNPGDEPVNISGWFLTDRKVDPLKFRIPDNTIIPPKGYIYFDESHFNADSTLPTSFTLNSHGEEVWIMADSTGALLGGYYHGTTFGELENGISIGRYITSDGRELFVPQKNITLGAENSGPLVGPIIISEIMYHSQDNASDYIEITNITNEEILLYHPSYPKFTWKIGGINFSFPEGISIKPGESIVIASDSIPENTFRARYNIPTEVKVFQMKGGLKNSTETISILKPEDPYVDTKVASDTLYPYMRFDFVTYSDQKPWPSEADGGGMSLHRISREAFGDDPISWKAAPPTPGKFE